MIDSRIKDEIKTRADILPFIEEKAKRSRFKNTFHCPLPGHDDHTPSFSVNPSKNLFYCHGCGRGGDVFTFIQKTEALSFTQALEYLANRLGIPYESQKYLSPAELDRIKQRSQERRERIAELNELEEKYKLVENALYDALRRCRYRLPHHKTSILELDAKTYSHSLMREDEIDRTFDLLDETVRERKIKFREERNNVYRS